MSAGRLCAQCLLFQSNHAGMVKDMIQARQRFITTDTMDFYQHKDRPMQPRLCRKGLAQVACRVLVIHSREPVTKDESRSRLVNR